MTIVGNVSTDPPPYINNRYRLVQWLGEGNMGIVYRAHDEMLDREIAIKFLPPEKVASSEASNRFLREARAVARLSHPNIMTLFDMGLEQGWHYLVLEYIPGEDLHAIMRQQSVFTPPKGLQVIRELLKALIYAHNQGLIHRDIKPENVMLTPDNSIKVTDFGLAWLPGDVRITQDGALLGTVLYLAPELIAGGTADERSDLYAVGAVFYELLTGHPPFPGDQPTAVLLQTLNNPPTPPSQHNPDIPLEIEKVILKLLSKEPAARYQTAQEAFEALPESLTHVSLTTTSTGSNESIWERIVRSSSSDQAVPPEVVSHLLMTAALEETAVAVENERKRLAAMLQENVIEPLTLLLSQASVYEQTMGANPTGKMAVSVLTTLARQVLQQVRDLETNLHPALLEKLGLEPALEALVNQTTRAFGSQITLDVHRLQERLPVPIELILYRITQDAIAQATKQAHASEIVIRLDLDESGLTYTFSDNGRHSLQNDWLQSSLPRLEGLSGIVELGESKAGGLELVIRFGLKTAVTLTPREMDVIKLVAQGLSNKEMAQQLFVSPRTINFHLDNIYSKLGVNSRTEAAVYAMQQGWHT